MPALEEWVWADTGKTVGWLLAGASLHSTPFVKTLASPGPGPGISCSTAALQRCSRGTAGYIHIVIVSSYGVARLPMNSKWSAAQQMGNCELELAGAARRGEARTVFAELRGGDCG